MVTLPPPAVMSQQSRIGCELRVPTAGAMVRSAWSRSACDVVSFIECSDDVVVIVLKTGDEFSRYWLTVILSIVADGMGIGHRLRHAVMESVDDRRLLGADVDQVW